MNTTMDRVQTELKNLWRHRWSALTTAAVVAGLGWTGLFLTPNTFEAQSRVYVDATSALKPLLAGIAVDPNVDSELNFVRQTMLSRPALEKVARQTELDLRATTPKAREALIDALMKKIVIDAVVSGEKGSADKLYTITYQDRSRSTALAVVTKLLNTFVEGSMGAGREGSASAQRFLSEQIHDTEARLADEEAKLAEFKKSHSDISLSGTGGDYFARLEGERDALKRAQSALSVASLKRDALKSQLADGVAFIPGEKKGGSEPASAGPDTAHRLQDAQNQLAVARLHYTERHPEVRALVDTVEQLKAQQKSELEAIKSGDPQAAVASGLTANPVYQQVQLLLNQQEVEVAGLKGDIADHQRRISELEHFKSVAPEVEAEFARLNRDYTVTHAQYTALVERLDRAKITEQANESGSIKFEVIDPPAAKLDPIKPDRLLVTLAIFGAALASGLAVGWLRGQLHSVYETASRLAADTGLPLLGSVSRMQRASYAERRASVLRFAATSGALLVSLVIAVIVALNGLSYSSWTG